MGKWEKEENIEGGEQIPSGIAGAVSYDVEKWMTHQNFIDPTVHNARDIAIVKTVRPVGDNCRCSVIGLAETGEWTIIHTRPGAVCV